MLEATCSSCKHWGSPWPLDTSGNTGMCVPATSAREDEPAYVLYASDDAALITRPYFGCVLYEAKGGTATGP